jgi:hypothetical protein
MAGSPQVIPDMRRGATVEGYPVGELIDIAFSTDLNRILALTDTGVLISCPPQLFQCEAEQLLGTENWVTPVALRTWQRNLYILDTGFGDGQIWRYVPSAGSFAIPPEEYFTGEARPVLRSAVDFGIDLGGAVYVLLAEGVVNKYSSGTAQPFDLVGIPTGLALESANGIFVDRSPIAQNLYIASLRTRTIFEAGRAGTWTAAYRADNEDYFAGLASVVVAPSQNMIYAVSGNAILAFERLQDDE